MLNRCIFRVTTFISGRLNNSFSLRASNMTLRNEYLFYAISICVNFDYENKFVFEK